MRLFDGINRVEYYDQVPFDRRLENKDVSNTFCYDENTKTLYLNGTVPFAGTLHINIIVNGSYIDPTSNTAVWTEFPARFLPLLGFYAVGVFKGAVDYDSINRLMLPSNQGALLALKEAMTAWDMEKQMSSLSHNDPTEQYSYPRAKAVDRTQ